MNGMELIRKVLSGEMPPPTIATTIGFQVVSAEPGRVVFAMETDPSRHANPMGTIHGGVLCDLADAAMGFAYATTLADGESFTTLELKINFLKPLWRARLEATGRIVRGGKTVGLVECDIVDERGHLVAKASSTCMTLRGEQAHGR